MRDKLVVFDLDGTLLNTIGDLAVSCNHMLSKRGLKEHTYDEYCHFVGNGVTRLVERALPEELRYSEYVASARKDFVDYYFNHIDSHTVPYSGIEALLSELQGLGATMAVASNKFHAGTCRLIEKFFPNIKFAAVYGNREGFPLKPDGAILKLIMEECGGFTAENTYMVGDSAVDMQTAHAAGTHSIGVSWGFRAYEELAENGAEVIVDTPEQLLSSLQH
ncbi:MAG: HAD-IA family hydrolase [Alistipes sp.]|nr:HAD-IA family hydrolase [Alistipes sp.]